MYRGVGWCITVEDAERRRMMYVAHPDEETARRLALDKAPGGRIITGSEVPEDRMADLNMVANEIKESAEIGRDYA